jgi:hypothetical protein
MFNTTTYSPEATFTEKEKDYVFGLVKKHPLKFRDYRLIGETKLNDWRSPETRLRFHDGTIARSSPDLLSIIKSLQFRKN